MKKTKTEDFEVLSLVLGTCSLAFKVSLQRGCFIFNLIYIALFRRFSAYFGILFLYKCIGTTKNMCHPYIESTTALSDDHP